MVHDGSILHYFAYFDEYTGHFSRKDSYMFVPIDTGQAAKE